jgi:hypothetical protein
VVTIGRLTAAPKSSAAPTPDSTGLTELGATEAQWKAQHMPDAGFGNSSFLPRNLDGLDRFVNVTFESGRVSGFIMQFDTRKVNDVAAKVIARSELPADASLVFESRKYSGTTDIDEQCDQLQYQSATVGKLLEHDRAGIVSIVLWSPSPQGLLRPYDPAGITSINILATGTLGVIPGEC